MHSPLTFIFITSLLLSQWVTPLSKTNNETANRYTYFTYIPIVGKNLYLSAYYIDSVGGSDNNSGTRPDQPWKTLSKLHSAQLTPGTAILLKRGSSWNEKLSITASGTYTQPITITAYGTGDAPILMNPGDVNNREGLISLFGDYIMINNLHLQQSGMGVDIFSNHNIIQNNEINNVGFGAVISGQYDLITNNYIHDTRMVHNDPDGLDDDYGADCVDIQNAHNEISYNRFENCEAFSYDYGIGGGVSEIFNMGDYTSFHHNWSKNSQNFMEISGNSPGSAKNVDIYYNVVINSISFTTIHNIQIENFKVENNTLIDLRQHRDSNGNFLGRYIIFMGTPSPSTSYIFRNNIVYISDYYRVTSEEIIHKNNLYYFLNPVTILGIPPGDNELVKVDPKFVDITNYDFHLNATSLAINTGMDLGYTYDFENNPVPVGIFPDIGAYEYQGN